MSKIRKISLIKKKWILKGIWLLEMGSNPHSKGDLFSRSWNDFLDRIILINIKMIEIRIRIIIGIINVIIIYIKFCF